MFGFGLQWRVVNGVTVAGFHGEDEGRYALVDERLEHSLNLSVGQQVTVAVMTGFGLPDHHAVLINVRQHKTVAGQQVA